MAPFSLILWGTRSFLGSIVLSFHSDGVDPKCFLSFSSGLSSADRKPHSPGSGNNVREPSMTTDTFSRETIDQADTSVGKNLPLSSHARSLKRQLSHDGIQSKLRRSERLARRARTWLRWLPFFMYSFLAFQLYSTQSIFSFRIDSVWYIYYSYQPRHL
jgi:hypothetical protein